jgi:polyisoprenoid-binding protein YceI
MKTTWTLDSSQSDVLIKMRHSIIAYMGGTTNKFGGYVNIEDNEIEDASVEFSLDINNKKDVTKVVELDAEFIGINTYNGERKVAFEIKGDIKRQDFGLDYNSFNHNGGLALGKDIKLIANLEFSI